MILYCSEVGFDKGYLVDLLEERHGTGVVHTGCEHQQQVVQEQRLVVEVELQSLVVQLNVGHLQTSDSVLVTIQYLLIMIILGEEKTTNTSSLLTVLIKQEIIISNTVNCRVSVLSISNVESSNQRH